MFVSSSLAEQGRRQTDRHIHPFICFRFFVSSSLPRRTWPVYLYDGAHTSTQNVHLQKNYCPSCNGIKQPIGDLTDTSCTLSHAHTCVGKHVTYEIRGWRKASQTLEEDGEKRHRAARKVPPLTRSLENHASHANDHIHFKDPLHFRRCCYYIPRYHLTDTLETKPGVWRAIIVQRSQR